MITIEQLDAKLSELQSMVAKFKAQKQPEPCPLEEGKEVLFENESPEGDGVAEIIGNTIASGWTCPNDGASIQLVGEDKKTLLIKLKYGGKDTARVHAQTIIGKMGGKSD